MSVPIQGIGSGFALPDLAGAAPSASAGDFRSFFQDAVQRVDDFQKNAAQSMDKLLSGETEEVHQTVLAAQRAELSLEFFLQVKNKAVQAYQEVMRMQL
jgi:flagellar hook-basal body complex protein FliE